MKIKDTGMTVSKVRYYAKKLGIEIVNGYISENDLDKIKSYKKDSIAQIAREYGVSRQYVHKLMLSLGVIKVGKKPNLELIREVMDERRNANVGGNK